MGARLAAAVEIRDAAAAERRMLSLRAHVRPMMPAALALLVCARSRKDADTGQRRGPGARRSPRNELRARGDEDEAKVVVERLEKSAFAVISVQLHLRGERRADAACRAQILELLQ